MLLLTCSTAGNNDRRKKTQSGTPLSWQQRWIPGKCITRGEVNHHWGRNDVLTVRRKDTGKKIQFSSVQSLSHVRLFVTPRITAHRASLSITNSQSSLRLTSIESVMPSSHLILCHPLLLPPSVFPSIRVFSSELVFCLSWTKYWSFSFSISPSNEYSGLILFGMDLLDLLAVQVTLKSLLQQDNSKHQFFGAHLSL